MTTINDLPRAQWSSFTSYLMVTTGAVVGLGNVVQFPYFVHQFGGAFVLLYILCELFVSIPILFAELLIGRSGKQNPVGSISMLCFENGSSRAWRWIGWLCFIILFLSLASYAVSVAFPVAYFYDVTHAFTIHGIHDNLIDDKHLINSFFVLETCFVIFLIATMAVIARGINRGLETISMIIVPSYMLILLVLAIYSCATGHCLDAIKSLFDFTPNASLTTVLLAALTYAFFKLNVGMGSMIVYGSYLPYSVPMGRSTIMVVCLDAIVSLLAYFVIYPLTAGSEEIVATTQQHAGTLGFFSSSDTSAKIVGLIFFFTAILTAWTPTIAMAESATVTLIERFGLSRLFATCLIFVGALLLGTLIMFSYFGWSNVLIFGRWTLAVFIDEFTSNVLIPLSALFIAIFVGWILNRDITANELGFHPALYSLWRFLVRIVAPVFVVGIAVMLIFG